MGGIVEISGDTRAFEGVSVGGIGVSVGTGVGVAVGTGVGVAVGNSVGVSVVGACNEASTLALASTVASTARSRAILASTVASTALSCATLASTVASMFGAGAAGAPAHAAVATTITAASKTITLLNWVAIAGYYTRAVTIQHVREGNPD